MLRINNSVRKIPFKSLAEQNKLHIQPHHKARFCLFIYFSTNVYAFESPFSLLKTVESQRDVKDIYHFCKPNTLVNLRKNSICTTSTSCNNMGSNEEFQSLAKIGALDNPNILIKDKAATNKIVSTLLNEQFGNLQLVVDFDYTLTRGHFNNEKSLCSWGILDNSPLMPDFYRKRASELLNKYYPIEVDPNMPEAQKIPHIVEWYENIVVLLKQCGITKKALSQMISESNVKLRDHTEKMFKKLKDEGVPLLIFSAGMGDVLQHVLWYFDLYSANVKVVSNFFKYNEEGVMVDFEGDLIHVFNKNENSIHSSDYFDQLKIRSNVILMGDSLGDVKMAFGLPPSSNVLKIGFYNHEKVSDRMNSYLDAYDIVLVRDQTMNLVNSILSKIES